MSEFYGNNMKWFVGEVAEVLCDFTGLFRPKVRCDGIHGPNIATNDLPLATVAGDTQGGANGIGINHSLVPTARVWGFFLDGDDCQLPMVCGVIPRVDTPPTENALVTGEDVLQQLAADTRRIVTEHNAIINQATNVGTDRSNSKKCWEFFRKKGKYNQKQIAAIIGNLEHEAPGPPIMDPTQKQIGGGPGRGIAQWEAGRERYKNLVNFAAQRNTSELDLITQFEFIHHELTTIRFHTRDFFDMKTIVSATMAFLRYYEMPPDEINESTGKTSVSLNHNLEYTWIWNKGDVPWNVKNGEEERLRLAYAAYRKYGESR